MKKLLAVLLALILIIAVVPTQVFATNSATKWTGTLEKPSKKTVINGVNYYEVSKAEELAYIAQNGGEWLTYNYILANDIVLNDVELASDKKGNLLADTKTINQWTPISGFEGVFNGNGYSISGVYVNGDYYAGFFSSFRGDLYNLTLKNSYVKGTTSVGGILSNSYKIGGEIEGCAYYGTVVGESDVGGISGNLSCAYVKDCTNYANIYATGNNVGGISGNFSSYSMSNCVNEGNVYSTGDYVGGITGGQLHIYSIYECINKGNVTGNNYVAGICPSGQSAYIWGSGNTGDIVGKEYVGGILGYNANDTYITQVGNGFNTGIINGTNYVGGIIGYATCCDIINVYNVGNVCGQNNVGAVAGYSDTIWGKGTANSCYYLKTDTINTGLNGFSNGDDIENVVMKKDKSFFCINIDRTLNIEGHKYVNQFDVDCDLCDAIREVLTVSGDTNGDKKINNKDLGLLMQKLNGWDVTINEDAADVNADGKVNNKDYGLLMQYCNGWDVELK